MAFAEALKDVDEVLLEDDHQEKDTDDDLLGAHEPLEVGSVDHATVNLELSESIVNL